MLAKRLLRNYAKFGLYLVCGLSLGNQLTKGCRVILAFKVLLLFRILLLCHDFLLMVYLIISIHFKEKARRDIWNSTSIWVFSYIGPKQSREGTFQGKAGVQARLGESGL
jgi:hypothetical protein